MSNQAVFRDHLPVLELRRKALAVIKTDDARLEVQEAPVKLTEHRHRVEHLAEGIYFTTQAALRQFASEF